MNTAPDHILIVDDDREIRTLLAEYLGQNGLRVSAAANGRELAQQLRKHSIDLVILDLMLPGEDGLTLCRNLRADAATRALPILMLTARREDMDRVLGLEMGADDYLTKPFVPRELLARIKAILRRSRSLPPNLTTEPLTQGQWHFSGWTLDTVHRHLLDPDGVVVPLTGGEYRLLHVLLTHPQRVLSRDQLLELTQGREAEPFDRSIDLLISRLRQRLRDDAREPRLIKTLRGEGYVLATSVQQAP